MNNNADARGEKGLFNSVYSAQLKIQIVNPCDLSVVNGDGSLKVEDLIVLEGLTETFVTYQGPSDTASIKYGNGYDLCGPLTYTIVTPSGQPF